jgi:hypothetical protein
MGSIFAEKGLYGSDAMTTNPAKSGRALDRHFAGREPPPAILSSGQSVRQRSKIAQGIRDRHSRPPPLLNASQDSKPRFLRGRSRLLHELRGRIRMRRISVSPQCPFMARDMGLWLDQMAAVRPERR